jgi:excisionase family DNA binding protein
MKSNQTQTLSIEEVAPILGVGVSTLYRSIARGEFPLPIIRIGGRILVPRDALEAVLRGESVSRTEQDAP